MVELENLIVSESPLINGKKTHQIAKALNQDVRHVYRLLKKLINTTSREGKRWKMVKGPNPGWDDSWQLKD